ncbi:MAG: protein TolR [Gemmatimonadota bacterium]|nr:MAG: protein TolR [Gemmatimonadota bacterium]
MRSKRRPVQEMNTQINITSLVDVTMMLLIIFVLVAPILNQGIELQLPEASSAAPEPEEGLRISLGPEGEIFFDGKPILPQSLDDELRLRASRDPSLPVLLEGDHRLGYGSVLDVLDRARIAGLTRVSLATEPRRTQP